MASCRTTEEDGTLAPPPVALAPPPVPLAPPPVLLLVRARSAVLNSASDRRWQRKPLPRSRSRAVVSVQRRSSAPSCRQAPPPPPTDGLCPAPWRCWSAGTGDVTRGGGLLGKRTSPFTYGPIRTVSVYPTCPSPPKTTNQRAAPARPSNQRAAPARPSNQRAAPAGPSNQRAATGTASVVIMPANQSSPWGGGGVAKPRLDSSHPSPLVVSGGTAAAVPSPLWKPRRGAAGTRTGAQQRQSGTARPAEHEEEADRTPLDARLRSSGTTAPTMPLSSEDSGRSHAARPPFLSSQELESPPTPPPAPRCPSTECPQGGASMEFSDAVQKLMRSILQRPPDPGNANAMLASSTVANANASLANAMLASSSAANASLASSTVANASLASSTVANASLASSTVANASLASSAVAYATLASSTLANSTLAKDTLAGVTLETEGQSEACESRSGEPTAASVCSLPISPGGAAEPGHKTAAAADPSPPCLTVCGHRGAPPHHAVPSLCGHRRAPPHNLVPSLCLSHQCADAHPRGSTPSSNTTACVLAEPTDSSPSSVHGSSPSSVQGSSPCATQDAVCLQASNQMSASVGSVANQISAIQLTNGPVPSCPSPLPEELVIGGQQIVDEEDDDDDFADEENGCSDDDGSDCSSIIQGLSTNAALSSTSSGTDDLPEEKPALVPSLFPNIPPTLYFSTAGERVALLPPDLLQLLKWKVTTVTPNVVRNTIARSHFRATKKSHDWLGCWGHHMKSPGFKPLREYQKLNHFPGSFQIGRKDRLWRNLHKMTTRFGRAEFSFFPRTFILPQDIKLLRKAWEDGGTKQKWIIKPPASARGIGIQVIHKWSQMPRKRPLLVQKYLHKPFLIGGNKFDLRIYVYVTSYDPLRIYVFSDGLVRFASVKYSSSMRTLGNKFMHLTNYSVNKKNVEYESNSDDTKCQGHKWALKALWKYLEEQGVDTGVIWEKIKDIVIKTIIVSDPYVNSLVKANLSSASSCHELFGFDIMLDENLKPWLLEVNISPSLHSNTALDVRVKGQMIRDLLNLAGFHLPIKEELATPPCSASGSTCSVYAVRSGRGGTGTGRSELSTDEKVKRAFYLTQRTEEDFLCTVLDVLTPSDVQVLAESEDELSRRGAFERVFPSARSPSATARSPSATARTPPATARSPSTTARYLRFFSVPRYLNLLLSQWEARYSGCRANGIELLRSLCQKGVHLGTTDPLYMWSKCSYVSRFEHRPCQPYRPTSSVVVSRWSRSRLLDSDNDDIIDDSDEEEEVRSVCSSPASSPAPNPQHTQ